MAGNKKGGQSDKLKLRFRRRFEVEFRLLGIIVRVNTVSLEVSLACCQSKRQLRGRVRSSDWPPCQTDSDTHTEEERPSVKFDSDIKLSIRSLIRHDTSYTLVSCMRVTNK